MDDKTNVCLGTSFWTWETIQTPTLLVGSWKRSTCPNAKFDISASENLVSKQALQNETSSTGQAPRDDDPGHARVALPDEYVPFRWHETGFVSWCRRLWQSLRSKPLFCLSLSSLRSGSNRSGFVCFLRRLGRSWSQCFYKSFFTDFKLPTVAWKLAVPKLRVDWGVCSGDV